ncbi:MAG TPA: ABC transporter permease [Lacunisphaera sp.]|jgi:ABC-type lipoprotein release transport system permease subunit
MNFADICQMALRNLQQAKLRAALTITGVVVGVTSLVCMVSFALGLQENLLNRTLSGFDIFTTIPVSGASLSMLLELGQNGETPAADEGGKAAPPVPPRPEPLRGPFAGMRRVQPRRMLDDKAVAEIEKMPGVLYVQPRIGFEAVVQMDGRTRQVAFSGAPLELSRLPGHGTLLAGTGFSNDFAREIVINESMINTFNSPVRKVPSAPNTPSASSPGPAPRKKIPTEAERKQAAEQMLGKEVVLLTLREQTGAPGDAPENRYEKNVFKIVGVLQSEESHSVFEQMVFGRGGAFVPQGTARLYHKLNGDSLSKLGETILGDSGYQGAIVRVKTPADTQSVYEGLNKMGLQAISLTQQLSQMKTFFMVINSSLALLAGISLLVAAIGISNTLIMSITERTREIGIMKAIGGDNRTIMSIFFCEAGLLGVLGGAIGVAGAWLLDAIANATVNHYIASTGSARVEFFFIPWYLWSGAILFAVGVSLLAAAYPAYRAARVDPIKALRHD